MLRLLGRLLFTGHAVELLRLARELLLAGDFVVVLGARSLFDGVAAHGRTRGAGLLPAARPWRRLSVDRRVLEAGAGVRIERCGG